MKRARGELRPLRATSATSQLVRRDAVLRRFAEFVDAGRGQAPVEVPAITSVAIVGGIQELYPNSSARRVAISVTAESL
jgi:hypothetical protein